VNRAPAHLDARPPGFVYHESAKGILHRSTGSILCCDEVPLTRLAQRFGTPLYIYSASAITGRLREFKHAFSQIPCTICYSVKANSSLGIMRLIAKMKCGFDVVSGGELERVLQVDRRAANRVVFSGVGKTREEIKAALKANILLFNVESESELCALADCAAALKKNPCIALRVNPDVSAETHPYISTGLHMHKFGVPIAEARALYARASGVRHLRVSGVSVHIGSQITDVSPFADAMTRVAELVRALQQDGHRIQYVDAGGGLGIAYETSSASDFPRFLHTYAAAISPPLRGLGVHLLLEPGRSIVGSAGALLTKVLYRKTNNSKNFLIIDAAMNDLLRPSLYNAFHQIAPVALRTDTSAKREIVDVVGPICESGDFFARERELPLTAEGDLLAVLDTGAYGMTLASNYNSRPRPPEVLVDGKSVKLIRRRETVRDMLRSEI
jgi:diaminopimelate decarboxylase